MIELPYNYEDRLDFLFERTNCKDYPHLKEWVEWVASDTHFFYFSDLALISFEQHSESVRSYMLDFDTRMFKDRFKCGSVFVFFRLFGTSAGTWIRGLFIEDSDALSKIRKINIDKILYIDNDKKF